MLLITERRNGDTTHNFNYGNTTIFYSGDYSEVVMGDPPLRLDMKEMIKIAREHPGSDETLAQLVGRGTDLHQEDVKIWVPLGSIRGLVAKRVHDEYVSMLENMTSEELIRFGEEKLDEWSH